MPSFKDAKNRLGKCHHLMFLQIVNNFTAYVCEIITSARVTKKLIQIDAYIESKAPVGECVLQFN